MTDHTVCLSLNQPLFLFLLCLWLVPPVEARPAGHIRKPKYMKLVSNHFVQIFALFSSYFISIDADSIIPSETLFFVGPFTAIGEFYVPPLHILLNKILGQLSVALAGERVLSSGYSLSRKKVRMDSSSILPTSLLQSV